MFENGNIDATVATVRSDLAVTTWLASTVPADLDILPSESGLPPLTEFLDQTCICGAWRQPGGAGVRAAYQGRARPAAAGGLSVALAGSPLNRLGATRRSTFSHKGRRQDPAWPQSTCYFNSAPLELGPRMASP